MDQTRQDFIAEIEELVDQILADLDELRHQLDATTRRRLLAELFRHTHSVKGSAGAIGLEVAGRIAHALEDLFAAVSAGTIEWNDALIDTLDDGASLLSESLAPVSSRDLESRVTGLIERLDEKQLSSSTQAKFESDSLEFELLLANLPETIRLALDDNQKRYLAQTLSEAKDLFIISVRFDLADLDQQFHLFRERLEDRGELISTHPVIDAVQPDKIEFRLLFASDKSMPELKLSVTEFESVTITHVPIESANDKSLSGFESQSPPTPGSVRVEIEDLESLRVLNAATAATTAQALELAIRGNDTQVSGELTSLANEIKASFQALEQRITALRLVPAGGILKRAERAGRAAARLTGKDVLFKIAGAELLLDKFLSEALASPLVHLVRNAVDHGIEHASDRVRLGKAARGVIRIEALTENDDIVVRVIDDGRGIDPEMVSKAATKAGLIDEDVVLDTAETLRLIFKPGFSTAGTVSTTSGRGVGLDVVETAVQKIGGEVRVISEPGFGATFSIRVVY